MAEKQQYQKRCNQSCANYLPNPPRCQLIGLEVKENQLCTNINSLYDIVKDLEDHAQSPPKGKEEVKGILRKWQDVPVPAELDKKVSTEISAQSPAKGTDKTDGFLEDEMAREDYKRRHPYRTPPEHVNTHIRS